MINTPLSKAERAEWQRCNEGIRRAKTKSIEGLRELGGLLIVAQEKRLWREDGKTFEAVIWREHQISRPRIYQLINLARLPLVDILDNERQYRELVGLAPEDVETVVAVAAAGGKPTTAKLITAKELVAAETKYLEGDAKVQREAEIIAAAEARAEAALANGSGHKKKRSRVAGLKGLMADIRGKVAAAKKKGAGLVDVIELIEGHLEEIVRLTHVIDEVAGTTGEED